MEGLTLLVCYLILFIWFRCKDCFKDFPVIEYTYVASFKVALWFVFALQGLIVSPCLDSGKGSEYAST